MMTKKIALYRIIPLFVLLLNFICSASNGATKVAATKSNEIFLGIKFRLLNSDTQNVSHARVRIGKTIAFYDSTTAIYSIKGKFGSSDTLLIYHPKYSSLTYKNFAWMNESFSSAARATTSLYIARAGELYSVIGKLKIPFKPYRYCIGSIDFNSKYLRDSLKIKASFVKNNGILLILNDSSSNSMSSLLGIIKKRYKYAPVGPIYQIDYDDGQITIFSGSILVYFNESVDTNRANTIIKNIGPKSYRYEKLDGFYRVVMPDNMGYEICSVLVTLAEIPEIKYINSALISKTKLH